MDTRTVKFTQYLRPHGLKRPVVISMPKDVAEMAEKIQEAGYVFTCEVLTTGQVSLAIEGKNCDVYNTVTNNDFGVVPVVEQLIRKFDFDAARRRDEEHA